MRPARRSGPLPAAALLGTVLLGAVLLPAGSAGAAGGCAAVFPDAVFEHSGAAGPVTVLSSGLTEGLADRFAADLEGAASAMQVEISGLDGVEVCLFRDTLPIDSEELGWPRGQILRAASFIEQRAVALSVIQFRLVRPTGILGLTHQALWQISDGSYPGAFGGAVAQWYRSRDADRLDNDRTVTRYARIIRSIDGPIPWGEGALEPLQLWNPQFQDSPVGDFVQFVVAAEGTDFLRAPDPGILATLDEAWQQELLVEARGSERPTSDWIIGAGVIGLALLATIVLAYAGWSSKRRERRPTASPAR